MTLTDVQCGQLQKNGLKKSTLTLKNNPSISVPNILWNLITVDSYQNVADKVDLMLQTHVPVCFYGIPLQYTYNTVGM